MIRALTISITLFAPGFVAAEPRVLTEEDVGILGALVGIEHHHCPGVDLVLDSAREILNEHSPDVEDHRRLMVHASVASQTALELSEVPTRLAACATLLPLVLDLRMEVIARRASAEFQ